MYTRWRYGLRNVHPTFYMVDANIISPDFVAHAYSFVGRNCLIGPKVELGQYAMIASNVAIVGSDHRFDQPGVPMIFSGRPELRPTVIETDVWVGHGATIMAGVRIGRGAIIAAGAVVTKDVPPYEIFAGVPARKIGERFTDAADRAKHDAMLAQPPQRGEYAGPLGDIPGSKASS